MRSAGRFPAPYWSAQHSHCVLGRFLHVNDRAVGSPDGQIVHLGYSCRTAVHANQVLCISDPGGARRENQVLRVEGVRDIMADRCLAYRALGSRSTMIWRVLPPQGNGTEAPCTVAKRVRMKFSPRSYRSCSVRPWPAEAELKNRHARGVVLQDVRRENTGWQRAQDGLHDRRDL